MIIYKIENKINGKIYIGQTIKTLEERIKGHIKYKKSSISKAINKYGIDNFNISTIDKAKTKKELNKKEKYWIKKLNSKIPNGYNVADGGDGGDLSNYIEYGPRSEETKEKLRQANLGKKASEETKEKLKGRIPWNKGKTNCFSSDSIKKMSESHKGQVTWIKGKNMKELGYINPSKGKPRPDIIGDNNPAKRPEVREKISKNNCMKNPEIIQKLIKTKTGMKYKPETKPRKKRPPVSLKTRKLLSKKITLYWKNKKEKGDKICTSVPA